MCGIRRSLGWRRNRGTDHPAASAAPQDIETGHGGSVNEAMDGIGHRRAEQEGTNPSAEHPDGGPDADHVRPLSTCITAA